MFNCNDVFEDLYEHKKFRILWLKNNDIIYVIELENDDLPIAIQYDELQKKMGDMYSCHPEQLTDNEDAIKKQMKLIEKLHSLGAEVLMSSHIMKFTPAERVLEIALEQKRRGADVIKIVTGATTMEQQIENLRITDLLKRELGAHFIFLSSGECTLHRRLDIKLGCCMSFCVYEHDALSTQAQPLLSTMKLVRDSIDF
ncbi:MAG: type I 3-dehydroquinate dehydratase [Ruminococcaceae bacterium]|nr:type I 3-dehydroquinate dehydratase [Oscillospiraceae bacterium]